MLSPLFVPLHQCQTQVFPSTIFLVLKGVLKRLKNRPDPRHNFLTFGFIYVSISLLVVTGLIALLVLKYLKEASEDENEGCVVNKFKQF
jgi:hypothetical protein